jgi:hypothetical protein
VATTAGTANTGGGGGGSDNSGQVASAGGSGIVIFRYLASEAIQAGLSIAGGLLSTSGGYNIHSFIITGSDTVTVSRI